MLARVSRGALCSPVEQLPRTRQARGGGSRMTPDPPAGLPPELERAVQRALRCTDTLCPPARYAPAYWREERRQIAACAAWQAAQSYDPTVGVSCELYAALCTQRAIYAEWRRLRADYCVVSLPVDPETGEKLEIEDPDACAAVWLHAECVAVREALATLRMEERQILEWRFGDGLCERAIAQRLGCSQPAVSRRIGRILRLLRQQLGVEDAPNSFREGL